MNFTARELALLMQALHTYGQAIDCAWPADEVRKLQERFAAEAKK